MTSGDRMRRAVLIALGCGLVVVVSKSLSLPETALSAYLVLFAARSEAVETMAVAFGLTLAALAAILLAIMLVMATAGSPILRVIAMFSVAFGAMYLARSTPAGIVAATIGMAIFEVLSVLDYLAYPDLLLRGLFWLMTVVLVPMAVLFVGAALFGRSARRLLSQAYERRLAAIGQAMVIRDGAAFSDCQRLLLSDAAEVTRLREVAGRTGQLDARAAARSRTVEAASARLLADCAAGNPPPNTDANRAALALETNLGEADPRLAALAGQLTDGEERAAPMEADRTDAVRFAIKATLSIAICYAIFLVLGWPAIHTITITAFLISLGSAGETLHKAALRISGCLLGAVIANLCLLLIVPNLQGIGGLAVLTFMVTLPAAWLACGPERTAYAGLQVALVFFLVVLNSPGPDVDFAIAWGRIVGILLGNLVVAVVFLSLWPSSISNTVARSLDRAAEAIDAASQAKTAGQSGVAVNAAAAAIAAARDTLFTLRFEPNSRSAFSVLASRADMLQHSLLNGNRSESVRKNH
ncbi:multidrug resistance protein MdtO [Aliiruegeria haliotis]|uniref:Multidrug resistance protein MdtO n=1 Tax=Aliiruegeria haliotis TaxID=1280846 RepID=A0A2T0RGZ3_9RHOB|nr:FUSC family protein [Aliiruegeria haliotis]PRY20476.1 multidrug resistance protein MdtO [Aliiruegeria haliotis]